MTWWEYGALLHGWNERHEDASGKMVPPTAEEFYDAIDMIKAQKDPAVVLEGYDDR